MQCKRRVQGASFPFAALISLWLCAVQVSAQPTYEQDMARQRAEEQRIQNDWMQDEDEANSGYDDDRGRGNSGRFGGLPTPQFAESHMAVAWNYDTSEVWATTGRRTGKEATEAALAACSRVMKEECFIAAHWINNSHIAVVVDAGGRNWVEGGASVPSVAVNAAMEACRKYSAGCKLKQVFSETPLPVGAPPGLDLSDNFFPQGPIRRHTHALVAWPSEKPPEKWSNSVWLSTGRDHWRAARQELLGKCQAATGVACEIGQTQPNGVILRFIDATGKDYWSRTFSAERAAASAEGACTSHKPCRVIEVFDSATPRDMVLDLSRASAPIRGFFAIAWPSKSVPNWKKLAIVTGKPSDAAARAAAIALCERESKAPCEVFLEEGDYGVSPFLAVYGDSAKNTRTYLGNTPAQLEARAKVACERAKVTCTQRVVLDLAKPVSITPAY